MTKYNVMHNNYIVDACLFLFLSSSRSFVDYVDYECVAREACARGNMMCVSVCLHA